MISSGDSREILHLVKILHVGLVAGVVRTGDERALHVDRGIVDGKRQAGGDDILTGRAVNVLKACFVDGARTEYLRVDDLQSLLGPQFIEGLGCKIESADTFVLLVITKILVPH